MPRIVPGRGPTVAPVIRALFYLLIVLFCVPWGAIRNGLGRLAPAGVPARPSGRVADFAGVLSDGTRRDLETVSANLDRETGAELAVVTVKDLGGEAVEKYSLKLFTDWGIGKKGKDNGVLLLVAPKEHKVWITTGYGVEGSLPDGLCGEISRQTMIPHFKANDYDSGTIAGARRIAAVLSGRDTGRPGPEAAAPSSVSANIMDEAEMLDAEARSTVAHYITLLKEKAGVDLFVVTIPSTGGRAVEEIAKERADRAGLAAGKGVLVLVSREGSKVAVETTPGLMSAETLGGLRKAVTGEITSALAKGNVLGGFWNAVARVWGVFGGRTPNPLSSSATGLILLALFLSIFILIGGFLAGAGLGSRAAFLSIFGAFFAGVPFFGFSVGLLAAAGTFWVTILHAVLGGAAFYGGLKVGKASPRSFRGTTTGTGWIWGGGGGGGGFGGGGGGGGFGGGFSGGGGGGGSW